MNIIINTDFQFSVTSIRYTPNGELCIELSSGNGNAKNRYQYTANLGSGQAEELPSLNLLEYTRNYVANSTIKEKSKDPYNQMASALLDRCINENATRSLAPNDLECISGIEWDDEILHNHFEKVPQRLDANTKIDISDFFNMIYYYSGISKSEQEVYLYHGDHLGGASWITDTNGQPVQHLQYLPFGESFVNQHTSGYEERFTFTGKEKDSETGYYAFGVRYYDPDLSGLFLSVDPMSDKYPSISPYAYCAWNPIKLVDPDGNKVVFVNGYLGFGSPKGGKSYWGKSFVSGAKSFFNDNTTPFFTDVKYGIMSSARERRDAGYDFAKENFTSLTEGMKDGESFKFVSHSMGGAFAMGMKDYLEEQGRSVESMVFINTYQSGKIEIGKDDPTFMVDYQYTNDPVLCWAESNSSRGPMKNADLIYRTTSNEKVSYRHAAPLHSNGNTFWNDLRKIIDILPKETEAQ